ncbi:MAG: helix-turn-helix domain-containing protein [Candidatus Woesearchaeota archaeon]
MLLDNKVLDVLAEFSSDYTKRVYGREIARKLKMNQKTVSNTLKKLEKENVLKFEKQGKNKYYFLNKFNLQIREIIKLIEINKKVKLLEKYKNLKGLFNKLERRSKGVLIVFGSYANFSANEKSDLDLFLIGKISDIKDLEKTYGKKINIIKSLKNKFNGKEYIVKEVIKNHVVLKGVEEFIDLIW